MTTAIKTATASRPNITFLRAGDFPSLFAILGDWVVSQVEEQNICWDRYQPTEHYLTDGHYNYIVVRSYKNDDGESMVMVAQWHEPDMRTVADFTRYMNRVRAMGVAASYRLHCRHTGRIQAA